MAATDLAIVVFLSAVAFFVPVSLKATSESNMAD